jgi:hypothetical protein
MIAACKARAAVTSSEPSEGSERVARGSQGIPAIAAGTTVTVVMAGAGVPVVADTSAWLGSITDSQSQSPIQGLEVGETHSPQTPLLNPD